MTDKPFVKVVWHDAQDDKRTWVPADEIAEFAESVCEVISWGWLVGGSKKSKYVTLAADYNDSSYGRVTKIPSGMIVTIEEFKTE